MQATKRPCEGAIVQRHIHFSVPLHLDPPGRSRMTHAWTTVRHVRGALVGYLQNQALSKAGSLRAAAEGSIRAARPGQSVAVPLISAEQLQALSDEAALSPGPSPAGGRGGNRALPARHAHMTADAGNSDAPLNDEVMALGLTQNRGVNRLIQCFVGYVGAQWRTQIGGVFLA